MKRLMPKVQIRVDLDGEAAEKFLALKKKVGLTSNAEMIRYLIAIVYEDAFLRSRPVSEEERRRFDEWEERKAKLLEALTKPEFLQMVLEMRDEIERLKRVIEEIRSEKG